MENSKCKLSLLYNSSTLAHLKRFDSKSSEAFRDPWTMKRKLAVSALYKLPKRAKKRWGKQSFAKFLFPNMKLELASKCVRRWMRIKVAYAKFWCCKKSYHFFWMKVLFYSPQRLNRLVYIDKVLSACMYFNSKTIEDHPRR